MKIGKETTDEVVMQELGRRVAGLRLGRNLTQAQLALEAGVSKRTVERLEAGEVGTQLSGFLRVCRVLGLLERLETFMPEPQPEPMELLRAGGRVRKRASSVRPRVVSERKWEWGAGS